MVGEFFFKCKKSKIFKTTIFVRLKLWQFEILTSQLTLDNEYKIKNIENELQTRPVSPIKFFVVFKSPNSYAI